MFARIKSKNNVYNLLENLSKASLYQSKLFVWKKKTMPMQSFFILIRDFWKSSNY